MKRILILFAWLLVGGVQVSADERKPNIIFILADDSGFADFGCQGHPYARTPNIDSLARDGTR